MPKVLNAKGTWFDGDGYSPNAIRAGNTWVALAPNAVYVGRPSTWGNPYRIGRDGTREGVVQKFRSTLRADLESGNRPDIEQAIKALKGKDLVCWCAPLPCHADVLLEIANGEDNE